ncbi:hypothetical protein SERLA73DRAFT_186126 [Serpula lacrymans var. lacrymans S7.3]|uniref:Uncharacterized protein n=2 Tax=Serpula lacrymans var. lacrymans TaxID=341189 RepID=F8Q5C6_SERL3|nr:uncharacterized protein SERLADRAFT_474991 [Serpula lacrymans var. lacrymans S7.9]EGN96397.1 hypothetical protein SERLA73DRAFT_186126 [Serpula lacrymans var. lacrymans S7.3]EGO21937.1 hypothetical protein SERLADRAFT_474991 [Serpula lacrymans var. lacrymans S7.9]
MSSKLSPYTPPVNARSLLLKNSSEAVPPTEELENLLSELRNMKQKTMERAKKAGEDLKVIEESMRRVKEREKGKARAIDKVKRERGFTPMPETDEGKYSTSPHNVPSKARPSPIPLSSLPPSSRSSMDPRRPLTDELKKKKKKRKRDEDSDLEVDSQRAIKTSPPVPFAPPFPPKPSKIVSSASIMHPKPIAGPDFSVPPPSQLLPARPPVTSAPVPGPSKPIDVTEDFSKLKQPSQVLVSTFYASVEPWIRGIKEEDIGFMEFTADEVEPYVIPKLGRHYTEVWEEMDTTAYGAPIPGFPPVRAGEGSTLSPGQKWDPSTLMESDLLVEERSHGPLTERLVSALLPMPDVTVWKGVKAAEDAMEGRPGGSGAAAARKEKMNVVDLEERIQDTMRFHGLLDGTPDYSEKVDDPIATALRQAQRELRTVVATNKARRARLAAISRDRLGYQEYLDVRESLDKNITTLYTKLQKKDGPKLSKKKKKGAEPNGVGLGSVSSIPPPSPAALGLGPDDENKLVVSDHLRQLVETRRQWVDAVGAVFEDKEKECPGRIWGLPSKSVYDGIEESIRRELDHAVPTNSSGSNRRTIHENGRSDEMDVG